MSERPTLYSPAIRFDMKLENDDADGMMEVECENSNDHEEIYTLRIPGKNGVSSQTIILSGEEFNRLTWVVEHFRKMKAV